MIYSTQDRVLSIAPGLDIQERALGGAVPAWLTGGISAAQCVAAYNAKGAADLAGSYVNQNAPGTHDATLGIAPTWSSALGWICAGTQWLNTDIRWDFAAGWSVVVRYSGMTDSTKTLFGAYKAGFTTQVTIKPRYANVQVRFNNGTAPITNSPQLDTGVLCLAGLNGYRNGVIETGTITAGTGTSFFVKLLANGLGDTSANENIIGNVQAIWIYNITLSQPQITALTTAINAL